MIEAQEMDPVGPDCEKLRGGLSFPLQCFRRFGFQTSQFDILDKSAVPEVLF